MTKPARSCQTFVKRTSANGPGLSPTDTDGTHDDANQGTQIDLVAWAQELEAGRQHLEQANERRAARRGYVVFAADPQLTPDEPRYREVFATEAKTPGEATAKVRSLADGRRLRACDVSHFARTMLRWRD